MLYWHFRNFQCILYGLLGSRIDDPRITFRRKFFANPFDSDWLRVVQANVFFTYTDAARWELGIRCGLLKALFKNKLVIIMGGQKIIHWRPVKIFRSFEITYQFAGWDDKWIYAAHAFRQGGKLCCVSFSKIGLRKNGKLFNPREAFALMGHTFSHDPPDYIRAQFDDDVNNLELVSKVLS